MELKNVLIVFNPKSGFMYLGNYRKYFCRHFKKYLPRTNYQWLNTTPRLESQLEKVNFSKFDRVIVIGGDGTVKIVADFILKHGLDLSLAVVPQGSANSLAFSLDIPVMQKSAIKTACLGKEKKMDVCLLNGRHYFFLAFSIGHLSKVINETSRGLKIKLGLFAYLVTFFRQKRIYQTRFNFELDGVKQSVDGNTFIVANALSLLKLKPASPIDFYDGHFDIFVTKNKSFLGFWTILFFLVTSKRWLPAIFKAQGKKIKIEYSSTKEKTVQIDGEEIALDRIEIEMIPDKLRIITC
ncbi:MAG TPA: diacylglycerol kinase family protein [Patescibacteria group bacterium]|nr:diacylglycerol kinase family protein [Patescibacteria group bacterium]